VTPRGRFLVGLLCMPAFMMAQNALMRLGLAAVYIAVYAAVGGRIRPVPLLVLFAGVLGASLVAPTGRILVTLGPVRVTSGAVADAISRFGLLTGMIYLSRLSVTPSLRLPGRIGGFAGRVLYYLERLTEARSGFLERASAPAGRRSGFPRPFLSLTVWADALDRLLLDAMYGESPNGRKSSSGIGGESGAPRRRGAADRRIGYPVGILLLSVSWAAGALSVMRVLPEIG